MPTNPTPETDETCWSAWFDGASLPNPGKIGIGVLLIAPDGRRIEKSSPTGLQGCNNEAELLAFCATLELARSNGVQKMVVHGDSDFAIRHLTGAESTAVPHLANLVQQARQGIDEFTDVQLKWIPRHRNQDADRLSRQALGLKQKPAETPGKSGRKQTRGK